MSTTHELDTLVLNTASKLSDMYLGKTWGQLDEQNGKPLIRRRDIVLGLGLLGHFTARSEDREGMKLSGSINRLAAAGLLKKVEKKNRVFVVVL
jgi:hypothetical protein